MYQEMVGSKNNKAFLFAIALFVFFLLVSAIELLGQVLAPLYTNIIVLLAFVLLALVFFRYFLCEFKYSVISDEFVIYRVVGRRETIAARIRKSECECLAPYHSKELEKFGHIHATCNTTSFYTRSQRYVMIYRQNGKLCRLIFQPSERLLGLLNDRIEQK